MRGKIGRPRKDLWDVFSDRFMAIPGGCWLWTGTKQNAKSREGHPRYGRYWDRWDQKRRLAHRLSWELHNGPIPGGMKVLHRCDVPLCVNPGHLFLGTIADNNADMAAKKRIPHRKLTVEQVREVRVRRAGGELQRTLAAEFGVAQPTISALVHRKSYEWVTI